MWRQSLRSASFRGVPFFVSDLDGTHGRRIASHEYPGRDVPYQEDMGRRARTFRVAAYVLEPSHIERAKRLIIACETAGPGTLVHPWLGEFQVVCTECRQRFGTNPQAIAEFDLEFFEAGEARYPAPVTNDVAAVDSSALLASNELLSEFGDSYNIISLPNRLAEDAIDFVRQHTTAVRRFLEPVLAGAQAAAHWTRMAVAALREAEMLARDPVALGERLMSLLDIGNVGALRGLVQFRLDVLGGRAFGASETRGKTPNFRNYIPLIEWSPVPNPAIIRTNTAARIQQTRNEEVFVRFARSAAAIQAGRAAIRQTFETYEDAVEARSVICDSLERNAEESPDAVYRTLIAVRNDVLRGISAMAPELPRIISWRLNETMPALALANVIYGDNPQEVISRSDEIVKRNKIRHPLFVTGGVALKVLSLDAQ